MSYDDCGGSVDIICLGSLKKSDRRWELKTKRGWIKKGNGQQGCKVGLCVCLTVTVGGKKKRRAKTAMK